MSKVRVIMSQFYGFRCTVRVLHFDEPNIQYFIRTEEMDDGTKELEIRFIDQFLDIIDIQDATHLIGASEEELFQASLLCNYDTFLVHRAYEYLSEQMFYKFGRDSFKDIETVMEY